VVPKLQLIGRLASAIGGEERPTVRSSRQSQVPFHFPELRSPMLADTNTTPTQPSHLIWVHKSEIRSVKNALRNNGAFKKQVRCGVEKKNQPARKWIFRLSRNLECVH
jgi:hypothetical protein